MHIIILFFFVKDIVTACAGLTSEHGTQGTRVEQPCPSPSFQWPTFIDDQFTCRFPQYSLEEKADISGLWSRVFAHLKSDLNNHKFLTALGNFTVDDPSELDRFVLANLRENKQARSNLT